MEPTADISHPVRDAFQEWGHKAGVAATYVALSAPAVMAVSPAYAHETGDVPSCDPSTIVVWFLGGFFGATITDVIDKYTPNVHQRRTYKTVFIGVTSLTGAALWYLGTHQ